MIKTNLIESIDTNDQIHILLTDEELDETFCRTFIDSPDCGGIVLFVGVVRNHTKGKQVLHLEFESRGSMAMKEMHKIALSAMEKWPVKKIVIHHRVGDLKIGEVPVVIGVAAAHRDAAFAACQFAIDTLKETVPIWKKEYFEDGEVWVAAHP